MSRAQRLGLIAAALAVAVIAFVLISPGGDDTAQSPTQQRSPRVEPPRAGRPAGRSAEPRTEPAAESRGVQIQVRDGRPVGGVRSITVSKGDIVRLTVSSRDTEDEVHLHGYDVSKDVAPDRPAELALEAYLEGIFEIGLEGAHVELARLEVRP